MQFVYSMLNVPRLLIPPSMATSQLLAELSLPTERIMTTRMSCLLLAVHLLATREMDSCNLLEYRT